jgi:hypothetical protein
MKKKMLKKYVAVFGLLIIFVGVTEDVGLSVSVTAEPYEVLPVEMAASLYTIEREGEYDRIAMEGFYTRGLPGAPELPQKIYDIPLSPDADLTTVVVDVVSRKSEVLDGEYTIGPGPFPASKHGTATLESGEDIYKADAFYPSSPVEILGTYQVRDTKVVRIQFTPMQYNPVTGKVQLTADIDVTITWHKITQQLRAPPPATWPGYAIITTNSIASGSAVLPAFVTHLQNKGFNVYVVTEAQYGPAFGPQRAINVRSWLQANYIPLQLQFVLLIGNPHPVAGDLPMLMCWPNPGSAVDQTPTDYFFADLTGNWDSDGDSMYGEYGEDAVDFGPEVYVARVPVYDDVYTTLDNILTKFINYTGSNNSIMLPVAISNYQDERQGPGCVAGMVRTDGLDLPQYVIQNIANPAGYTSYVMYERSGLVGLGHDPVPPTAFGYDAPLTNGNVITQWANDYGVVFWWGHGSPIAAFRKFWSNDVCPNSVVEDGVCCGAGSELSWPPFLGSADTALLPDTATFTFQCSCLNGYPENINHLGFALLRQGAICTVSASRISWYAQAQWTNWGITDNAGIGYAYVDRLMSGQPCSKALYDGKNSLVNPWAWVGWQNLFDFNLYGDPSLTVSVTREFPEVSNEIKQMCSLSRNRIRQIEDLLLDIQKLIDEAQAEGKDTAACEALLAQAKEAYERAQMYIAGNCIASNNLAIKAIELLEKARKCLEDL